MAGKPTTKFPVPSSSRNRVIEILRQTLQHPHNRKIWEQHSAQEGKTRPADISIRAISRALSNSERKIYGLDTLPDKYKDRVWRALEEGVITAETIGLFVNTFNFEPQLIDELMNQLSSKPKVSSRPTDSLDIRQVTPINSFYNFYPTADPLWMKVEASVTLSCLERGCQFVTIHQPQATGMKIRDSNLFEITQEDSETWRVTPHRPFEPLQVFVLRFDFQLATIQSLEDCTQQSVRTHFFYSTPNVSVRYLTGGQPQEVSFKTYPLATEKPPATRTISVATQDFCSTHYSALEDSILEISWKDLPLSEAGFSDFQFLRYKSDSIGDTL